MQVRNTNVQELLNRLRSYFRESDLTTKYADEKPPLRAELFNTEQLEQYGKDLARTHKIRFGNTKDRLLKQLAKNEKILIEVRNLLTESIKEERTIAPAGEWLLDNFYLIQDHISTGKRHLPKGYSQGLPRLVSHTAEDMPRIYDVTLELITHTDGRIDLEGLHVFVTAYQSVAVLQLGELWAIPIVLRLALIENLMRVASRVAVDRVNRNLAEYWSSLMKETAESDPKSLILVIADMARSNPPLESSFVAEMVRLLMWKGPDLSLPLTWMEQRLSESNLTCGELVNIENQKQAADQVSISNCIGSLRLIGTIEWHEFVEQMSIVEQTLRKEISGIYPNMEFSTRDRYRHIVEKIAKNSMLGESGVAALVIQFANESVARSDPDERRRHVGFYLVDDGLKQTEQAAKRRLPLSEWAQRVVMKFPLAFYVGTIGVFTGSVSWLLVSRCYEEGLEAWILVFTAIISVIGGSHLATALTNWLANQLVKPDLLPRMDFSGGIPPDFKTLVVVPTMLSSERQTDILLELLEVRFLANRDEHLHFGLLTDFLDAPVQTSPEDEKLLQQVRSGIEGLNRKYGESENRFFLFHRPRKWNRYDKIWMGYERKRGKLCELNELLRGNAKDNFSLIIGNIEALLNVKYVITLDTDTLLPRDAAWKLVGTMAHPLNVPYYDGKKQRITKGYTILQPRISVNFSREESSIYRQVHGNEPGIDPYTRLTSDVYQDLFKEGSFVGKGIYDVDAFFTAIHVRFPENRILSHDLLEGCYARSGLVSDVQLYEEYPLCYSADVKRRYRWIRGDWQIGFWTLPFVPGSNSKLHKNPISALSKWKIFDNLRRSLVSPSLTLLLLLGWTILNKACFVTIAVVIIIMLPAIVSSVWLLVRKPKEMTLWHHVVFSATSMKDSLVQCSFMLICLPYEAYYSVDAIMRTCWRMAISHRNLLEWIPSGHHTPVSDDTVVAAYRSMMICPFLALITFEYIVCSFPDRLAFSLPVLIAWTLAPFIAWRVSKPRVLMEIRLGGEQIIFLRRMARKTWAFFEQFVGPDDNWLPPDNYQEIPNNAVAHRTSPTNIGLALLANLSAYDFGYITAATLISRSANTMNTLRSLERYKGHLYNWYDTVSLKPLHPRYLSTVDSGNMAGHLLTFRQGLLSIPGEVIIRPQIFEGLIDTISIIEKEIPGNAVLRKMRNYIAEIDSTTNFTKEKIKATLQQLVKYAEEISDGLRSEPRSEALWWAKALLLQAKNINDYTTKLFPRIDVEDVPQKFLEIYELADTRTLQELADTYIQLTPEINRLKKSGNTKAENDWLELFRSEIMKVSSYAKEQILSIGYVADLCNDFASPDYDLLYDKSKHLLSIGYNVEEHQPDAGYYDLLASEASLCSFVAIAQDKLPQESWFALGRLLTNAGGKPILLSWSGSMFEYLMPLLVMPDYDNTLIHQTRKAVVARQIAYGTDRNVPWGISESGYNMVDANLNYQYQAFGVPGLGLKRGLSDNLVIAPYASMLALMVAPEASCRNLELLSDKGFEGRYGLYEAIDYTPSRLPRGQSYAVIQSFMSHHQGMSLLSLAYALLDQPMQKRFQSELQFQANILLLQERIPKTATSYVHTADIATVPLSPTGTGLRVINTPHTPVPEIQLLSNGRYHVMVTNAGGGYSRWKDIDITRWREDATCDNWGTFCYIRDKDQGTFWSNSYQPTLRQPKKYEVTFSQGRAEFRHKENNIECYTEMVVSPEDDIEIRRVHITNRSRRRKIIELTSYGEVVLTSAMADKAHPAFSNLFVQTEIIGHRNAILCTRRPRSQEEHPPSVFHLMSRQGGKTVSMSYESDRSKFIGRGKTAASPLVMTSDGPLSNTQGSVLDPIVAIRFEEIVEPEETVTFDIITGVSETRDGCLALIEKYQDKHHKDRVFELTWTHSQVLLRQINATEADARIYCQLASAILYSNPLLRGESAMILRNRKGQSGLWPYSVSGDLPVILLEIEDQANIELVRQLVQAHTYWKLKGLATDLVILNEDHGGYRQVLQNQILGLIATSAGSELIESPGAIFLRASDQISNEDRILFQAVARINISDKKGTLEDFVNRKSASKNNIPLLIPAASFGHTDAPLPMPDGLLFFNGTGGFTSDGLEYCIITKNGGLPPAPWVNVLSNQGFGTIISECGQSYTWSENAHEFRLTPWENDPVCDKSGEVFYIRDEDSGHFWSPAPLPAAGVSSYIIRHGFGYSIYEHIEDGIYSEMQVFVDMEEPVKFVVIKLTNHSDRQRRISVTGFVEWILGDVKSKTAMHITTEIDASSDAVFAKNKFSNEFDHYVAFYDTDDRARKFTTDRTEFIGRNGSLKHPDAMTRTHLSGKVGAALDPCAAIRSAFSLTPGQEGEVVFRLGAGDSVEQARELALKFKGISAAHESLRKTKIYWSHTLTSLQVETPDQSLNVLTNGWLMYQTITCRLWARSGYYQSGGAFGFRDQLQDVLAVIHTQPSISRRQILLCASRQFKEGDVQHWWHPPAGRGVRTRCSDDLLWLPYVTSIYILKTGDRGILDENIQFLEGRLLDKGENSSYDLPVESGEYASLYQHCKRAIEYSLKFGEHGIPLIGSGDWNDGMDMVGSEGKGESVWLGFFLYDVLMRFVRIAGMRDDNDFTDKCLQVAGLIKSNIEKNGWDGNWYRRAYFDDGAPLGSVKNTECQIDSISQSWAIISGAGEYSRSRTALAAADKMLVNTDEMLIQLLDPPFDHGASNPGYIKGYVPGIRENGGQYTHAAIWMIMAYATLGNSKRAWELLDLVNPINHGNSPESISVYKTEPYVVAADVYSMSQNCGRGGWTWYTGSAGWMYQLIIDWLLGVRRDGNILFFKPCIPEEWESYKVRYRFLETDYLIIFTQKSAAGGDMKVTLDGKEQENNTVYLVNDKSPHTVEVLLFIGTAPYPHDQ